MDGREKTDLYEVYEKVAGEMGLNILKNYLPDSKRFRKEGSEEGGKALFRSTLLPPDRQLIKGSNIDKLAEEIFTLINLKP